MMEYAIVSDYLVLEFAKQVNTLIKLGWEPQGGVAITTTASNDTIYVQAMVKRTK